MMDWGGIYILMDVDVVDKLVHEKISELGREIDEL